MKHFYKTFIKWLKANKKDLFNALNTDGGSTLAFISAPLLDEST